MPTECPRHSVSSIRTKVTPATAHDGKATTPMIPASAMELNHRDFVGAQTTRPATAELPRRGARDPSLSAFLRRPSLALPLFNIHSSILESAGLIWRKREGQFILYGMEQEQLAGHLWTFMQEVCPPSRALRREVRQEMDASAAPDDAASPDPTAP
ncbi:hypothetical protein KUL25_18670 [Rhodobacteraceae bacterium N5(2021)]|uniref:ArsR family transcriptional regulator n=1 Tax=Gymnodinialimonas phycosphaerae TaxID=2841589 RepID=A0A975TUB9_9RHOB|nr:hypothetical protein [Gymnodinialimonas phycosphaerae]MBY4894785.1 hypothetical protein [Gymnodinialimonas phycosphaerae]